MNGTQAQADSNTTVPDSSQKAGNESLDAKITGLTDSEGLAAMVEQFRNGEVVSEEEPAGGEQPQPTEPETEEEEEGAVESEAKGTEQEEKIPARIRLNRLPQDRQDLILKLARNPDAPLDALIPSTSKQPEPPKEEATTTIADGPKDEAEAQNALTLLKTERRKAMAEEMDFAKVAELDERIDALKDTISDLRVKRVEAEAEAKSQFVQTIEQSKSRAVEVYPDVTNESSALSTKMAEIDQDLQNTGNPLFSSPDKYFKIAQMAANELGIAPHSKAASQTSKPAVPAKPVVQRPIQPASGNARTTTQSQNRADDVSAMIDELKDMDSYVELTEKLRASQPR